MTEEINMVDFIIRMFAFACGIGAFILQILTIRKFKKLEKSNSPK